MALRPPQVTVAFVCGGFKTFPVYPNIALILKHPYIYLEGSLDAKVATSEGRVNLRAVEEIASEAIVEEAVARLAQANENLAIEY